MNAREALSTARHTRSRLSDVLNNQGRELTKSDVALLAAMSQIQLGELALKGRLTELAELENEDEE